jgi:hypothetical protein
MPSSAGSSSSGLPSSSAGSSPGVEVALVVLVVQGFRHGLQEHPDGPLGPVDRLSVSVDGAQVRCAIIIAHRLHRCDHGRFIHRKSGTADFPEPQFLEQPDSVFDRFLDGFETDRQAKLTYAVVCGMPEST